MDGKIGEDLEVEIMIKIYCTKNIFSGKKNRLKNQILSSSLVAYNRVGHSILELTCSNMTLGTGKEKFESAMQELEELVNTA